MKSSVAAFLDVALEKGENLPENAAGTSKRAAADEDSSAPKKRPRSKFYYDIINIFILNIKLSLAEMAPPAPTLRLPAESYNETPKNIVPLGLGEYYVFFHFELDKISLFYI